MRHKELVGRNIALARQLAGLSQDRLARRLETSRTRLSDWERGRHQPSDPNLRRIAEALELPTGWFHADHADYPADVLDADHPLRGAVIATTTDWKITAWNRGAVRLLGWTTEEAVGRSWLDLTQAVDGKRAERLKVLVENEWWRGPVPLTRKDGTTVKVEATGSVLHDGPLLSYLITLRQIE